MKYILILFAVVILGTIQTSYAYRGDTFEDVTADGKTHTWTGGLSPWLDTGNLDADGRKIYIHYTVDDQPTYVQVSNGEASFIFDKTTCSAKIYKSGFITDGNNFIVGSDSYTPKSSVNGTNTWSIVNSVDTASCVTQIIETANSIEVSGTKTSAAGIFKIKYLKELNRPLKTILEATNLSALTDRQFGLTQTQSIPQVITFGGVQRDLANHIGETFDRTFLENNKANLLEFSQGLKFDTIDAWNNLESIKVNSVSGGIASVSFNYFRNAPILLPSQTLVIDPTYGYTSSTSEKRPWTIDSIGVTCDASGFQGYFGGGEMVYNSRSINNDACIRDANEWDITSIPDNAIPSNVNLRYDITATPYTVANCDFNNLEVTQPSTTGSPLDLWNDIGNGTSFVSNDAGCTTIANDKILDLGVNADSALQSSLSRNWFGVGIKLNDEARGATERGQSSTGTFDLEVTYTIANTPDRINDLIGANLTNNSIDLSWTQPGLNGGNLTNYKLLYTSPYGTPGTFLANTTSIFYNMTGLTSATQYSVRVSALTEGGYNFTGNIFNFTTLNVPSALFNVTFANVGDTLKAAGIINVTSGSLPVNATTLKLYQDNILVKTDTIFSSIAALNINTTLDNLWYQITDDASHQYALVVITVNSVGTTNTVSTVNATITREYDPDYFAATDNPSTQGNVNATTERFNSQDGILLKVNRIGGTLDDTWQIECIAQTNSEAARTKNETAAWEGTWSNTTNTGYFNTTFTGFTNSHAYITCFNDDELFTLTDFTTSSLALLGIQLFDESYGSMLGVPVGVFFLVMTAGMATKRTAPTFIIVVTGIAGTMATIGFFSFEPVVWGLALVTAMLGIFVNQKIF